MDICERTPKEIPDETTEGRRKEGDEETGWSYERMVEEAIMPFKLDLIWDREKILLFKIIDCYFSFK